MQRPCYVQKTFPYITLHHLVRSNPSSSVFHNVWKELYCRVPTFAVFSFSPLDSHYLSLCSMQYFSNSTQVWLQVWLWQQFVYKTLFLTKTVSAFILLASLYYAFGMITTSSFVLLNIFFPGIYWDHEATLVGILTQEINTLALFSKGWLTSVLKDQIYFLKFWRNIDIFQWFLSTCLPAFILVAYHYY